MRRGIWIMQTCTARQLPTSRLRGWKISNLLQSLPQKKIHIQNVQCVPQTNVVLHRKLDPVNYLRKLWYHCQQCDANKVLKHTNTHGWNRNWDSRYVCEHFLYIKKTRQEPVRWKNCSAGAECSLWGDLHSMPSRLWQLSALPEPSIGTSGRHDDLLRHSGLKKKKEICGTPKFSPLFILSYFKMTS